MRLIVALCLIAVVLAAPQRATNSKDNVALLRNDNSAYSNGKYNFGFEQSDGQSRVEQGQVKNAGLQNESISVKGSYHWVGPDGVEYHVNYNADENGYQPEVLQGPGGAVSPQLASLLGG